MAFWQSKTGSGAGQDARPAAAAPAVASQPPQGRDRMRAAAQLLHSHEQAGLGWFWATDAEGRLTYLTASMAHTLGIDPDAVPGTPFLQLFQNAEGEGERGRTLPLLMARQTRFDQLTLRTSNGDTERWWALSGRPQSDALGQFSGYLGSGLDITTQKLAAEEASRRAMLDTLTGLPNRRQMTEHLEASLVRLGYQNQPCAVMLLDLDRFKQVNDTLGHPAGDALLVQVAQRLSSIAGQKEDVFRLGGDEFQIVVRECGSRDALAKLAQQVITTLSEPYFINGSRCIIGASVGIAVGPEDGWTAGDLIRNADLALYAAKDRGRGCWQFFDADLLEAAEDRRRLEEHLRDALARDEIKLFYQPIVDAETNIMTGVEALVRWHHRTRGPISPALFIPIAEETNLIKPLGEWVLRKACEDAARWPGKLKVAVNVSPIQFADDSLPATVLSALASSGLPADRLELEITESVFLDNSADAAAKFATLKDLGVRLALDDFGTGYSSLSYLRTAPFDKIKIDQSFVQAATLPRSRNRAIIAAIVALAEALGMETTAEGIESHDQLDLIRTLKVSHAQGYIYSRPIPPDEIEARIEDGVWEIEPAGPQRQRAKRHTLYRRVGCIYGNYYRSVLIRNLSESGALVEQLMDVPIGSLLLIDFGEGHLSFARVRRTRQGQYGIEFEQPLVADRNGALVPPTRVSPYLLARCGLPSDESPGAPPAASPDHDAALDKLRSKLGLGLPPGRFGPGGAAGDGGAGSGSEGGAGSADGSRALTAPRTLRDVADRHLASVRNDPKRHDSDSACLARDILPQFGHLPPDALTPTRVAAWLTKKAAEPDCTPAKLGQLQSVLGELYLLAMQWGMPGAGGERLKDVSILYRGPGERTLTREETDRLLAAAKTSTNRQLHAIVSLIMQTGIRQRELLNAQWPQIDLDKALFQLPAYGRQGARTVHLTPAALEILRALPRSAETAHVIVNPQTRKPYRSLAASWETARRKARLPDVEIDDLRHSMPAETADLPPPVNVSRILRRAAG